jgi:hypothetical protein
MTNYLSLTLSKRLTMFLTRSALVYCAGGADAIDIHRGLLVEELPEEH